MLFNVPQYIDVEDKVAGPFTAKQLFWMFGMGVVLMMFWGILEKTYFYIAAVPVVIIFMAFAFYRPYGQPLVSFIFFCIMYVIKPKAYFWNREAHQETKKPTPKNIPVEKKETQGIREEKVKMLAEAIDSYGTKADSKLVEYIKEQQQMRSRK